MLFGDGRFEDGLGIIHYCRFLCKLEPFGPAISGVKRSTGHTHTHTHTHTANITTPVQEFAAAVSHVMCM